MPAKRTKIRSSLTPLRIGQIFHSVLERRGVRFEPLHGGDESGEAAKSGPELSVVASHHRNLGKWAIELTVHKDGDGSAVEMKVIYHSALRRAWSGASNTYSRPAGAGRAQLVLEAFRREDRRLEAV